jgi:branched-chain amino acid transport system permease protein
MKKSTILNIAAAAAGLGFCVLADGGGVVSNTLRLVLEFIAINAIFVLGVNLVNGYLGVFSLAHAGIMAVGGYAASLASMYLLKSPALFPLSLLIGGCASMLVGLLIAFPSFSVRGDYLAIITLGASLLVQSVLENIDAVGAARGLRPIPHYTSLTWCFAALVLAMIAVRRLVGSKYGRSLLAIRRDQVAAELVSVDVRHAKLVAFGFSSFLIGVSGGLLCHLLSYTNPGAYGYSLIVDGLIMVYLGGIGSITGSIAGAAIWQLLVQTLRPVGLWRWILGGVILIALMIFKPEGLFGNAEFSWRWLGGRLKAARARLSRGGARGKRSGGAE